MILGGEYYLWTVGVFKGKKLLQYKKITPQIMNIENYIKLEPWKMDPTHGKAVPKKMPSLGSLI